MKKAATVVNLVAALQPVLQGAKVRRFLPRLAEFGVMVIALGIVAGGIMIGAFFVLYRVCLVYGYAPLNALLLTLGAATVLLLLGLITLQRALRPCSHKHVVPLDQAAAIVDAFWDGLCGKKPD